LYLVLYAYVSVFAHSHFIENPLIWSWEIDPSFLRWFCHSWYQSKIGVKHTRKHLKSQQRFRWGTLSPHKDSSSFFRWQANLCVNLCNYGIASTKVCCDFWSVHLILLVVTLFCCLWPCRTIRACVCLLLLFMDIFGCLCLGDRTWVGTSVLVLCGHEWVLRYRSFVDMGEKWWSMWSIFCSYTNSR
jgi:hypothetical protein